MKFLYIYTTFYLFESEEVYEQLEEDTEVTHKKFGPSSKECHLAWHNYFNAGVAGSSSVYPGHEVAILNRYENNISIVEVTSKNLTNVRRKIRHKGKYFVSHEIEKLEKTVTAFLQKQSDLATC